MNEHTWESFGIELPFGASGEVRVTCPKCTPNRKPGNQRRKDLAVNTYDNVFVCHHCGWSGSLATGQGERSLPPQARTPVRKTVWEEPRPLPAVSVPTLWEKVVEWFAERGIPESALTEFGITASSEYCPMCEGEVGNTLFPYYVDGKHINTKHRCGKKHFRMEKGAQRVLYNLDAITDHDTIYIVEGEIDAMSVHAAGFPNVVSVPDGAPAADAKNYNSKFSFLEAAEDKLAHVRKFIIATDADAPGQKLMDELVRRFGPEKCSRVVWPEGIKDANECLVEMGDWGLASVLDMAEPVPVEGIITFDDLARDLDELYRNGEDPGLTLGYPALDAHYRVAPGYMSIVTGIPGHGKSGVIDQLVVRMAERHGWPITFFSPEQQPLKRHAQHILELRTGKPFLDGPTPRMTPDEVKQASAWANLMFSFIDVEEPSIDIILEKARVEVYRRGIKGMVIDPWNELEHHRPNHMSETEYISDALSRLRRFARMHDLHLWIIAHPTKLRRNEDGSEPVPGLYDISGSANFRNKADMGLSVWRDISLNDSKVQVHVTKVRYTAHGDLGAVSFGYDRCSKRLYEIGDITNDQA